MDLNPRAERRAIEALLIAVGTAVTEGPVGTFIRGWSQRRAILAWSLLAAVVIALFGASVAFERQPIAKVLLGGAAIVGLVMVFVGYVRNEVKRERERSAFQLSRRGRRTRAQSATDGPAYPPAAGDA